tara:strand:- start:552 stop:2543 length:1992 start_codon:yes stop_codon:yes gene_type:complete
MASYSKVSNKTQDKDVKYLNKDFNSFKSQLIEFTQTYYPNTFNDFSEGSPGMMFLEMAAYVGDVLSFYTDTQLRETFLLLAQEKENIYNLAYALGYKPKVTTAASTNLDIFQLLPSKLANGVYLPDYDYALTVNENSTFSSTDGIDFYTENQVNFGFSSSFDPTTVSVYQYDSSNNPEYFLLKKSTLAVSAEIKTQTFSVGAPEQFRTITLFDTNIISIESVVDTNGNKYYEVPYLAQDTIFEEVENTGANDPELNGFNQQTPYLLKVIRVPRRFVARHKTDNTLELQFGAGISDKADEDIIPNPDNIGLGIKDGRSKLDVAYDPSNFLYTKAYGQIPSNTTITVTYLTGGGLESNVNSNTITQINTLKTFNKPNINNALLSFIKSSVAVSNPQKAAGGGAGDTVEEIRMNAMAAFSAQKRTVTKEDYLIRTLSMPPRFGRVAKAYITQDDQISPLTTEPNRIPNPLALNLYTLGYDRSKKLTTLNTATKTNLSTYLEQYRMLTDAINIKDAFVINFTVDFEIVTFKSYNNEEVILNCIAELKDFFDIDKWQINQPIIISEVYNLLGNVLGVQSVESVSFNNVSGTNVGYSQYKYDFTQATRGGVIYPSLDPSIFEIKNLNNDIRGRVTTYGFNSTGITTGNTSAGGTSTGGTGAGAGGGGGY